jgi:hypothetical protein
MGPLAVRAGRSTGGVVLQALLRPRATPSAGWAFAAAVIVVAARLIAS